jgi:hypothetical protein
MGDRVFTKIIMLKEHSAIPAVAELMVPFPKYDWPSYCDPHPEVFVEFEDDNANYAVMGVEDELAALGIPYDKKWEEGGEFGSGAEYHRIDAHGKSDVLAVYDDTRKLDPDIINSWLRDDALTCHETLQGIQNAYDEHMAGITPLPWLNQSDNSLTCRTNKLIGL